jgi:hypothetical protein
MRRVEEANACLPSRVDGRYCYVLADWGVEMAECCGA